MSIGNLLTYAIMAIMPLIYLWAMIFFAFKSGQNKKSNLDGVEVFDFRETPDAVFVRGTKGFLVWLGALVVIGGIASSLGDTDTYITKSGFVFSLIVITPGAISYLVGVYTAYIGAQKRIK